MANQKHLDILKQGVEVWNQWRQKYPEIYPDLIGSNLAGKNLSGINLHGVDLSGATLSDAYNLKELEFEPFMADPGSIPLNIADLNDADLSRVYLSYVSLRNANLIEAKLSEARLQGAHLSGADLNRANLLHADLSQADLSGANLSHADLSGANLNRTYLSGANLSGVKTVSTVFTNLDLRAVKGLAEINHVGPSPVLLHTVQLPSDGSALHFLRGAGVPDEWIDFWRSTTMSPVHYHSVFISYTSKDEALAHRLYTDLQDRGVRCWFAPEDMKIGDKIRSRIDEAIHLQDKLLLLLSEHSLDSPWVEDEVEAALEKEQRQQREVLFPVRLDESVMQTSQAWATKLRRTRHIGDFTRWTDPQEYQQAFGRLLRDLKAQF
ncbi:MAG TPA: toll/interleukin-1 receptor domain-containing protein [Ktedonosporobacter sp.]|jgi:hypothetical protein|nr:toll/interleukin-1 receptor domain-containing protein [Ktedonosporobacter sp.]